MLGRLPQIDPFYGVVYGKYGPKKESAMTDPDRQKTVHKAVIMLMRTKATDPANARRAIKLLSQFHPSDHHLCLRDRYQLIEFILSYCTSTTVPSSERAEMVLSACEIPTLIRSLELEPLLDALIDTHHAGSIHQLLSNAEHVPPFYRHRLVVGGLPEIISDTETLFYASLIMHYCILGDAAREILRRRIDASIGASPHLLLELSRSISQYAVVHDE
jgi:hypothetical protein